MVAWLYSRGGDGNDDDDVLDLSGLDNDDDIDAGVTSGSDPSDWGDGVVNTD